MLRVTRNDGGRVEYELGHGLALHGGGGRAAASREPTNHIEPVQSDPRNLPCEAPTVVTPVRRPSWHPLLACAQGLRAPAARRAGRGRAAARSCVGWCSR
jgi:hypothetical protein